ALDFDIARIIRGAFTTCRLTAGYRLFVVIPELSTNAASAFLGPAGLDQARKLLSLILKFPWKPSLNREPGNTRFWCSGRNCPPIIVPESSADASAALHLATSLYSSGIPFSLIGKTSSQASLYGN